MDDDVTPVEAITPPATEVTDATPELMLRNRQEKELLAPSGCNSFGMSLTSEGEGRQNDEGEKAAAGPFPPTHQSINEVSDENAETVKQGQQMNFQTQSVSGGFEKIFVEQNEDVLFNQQKSSADGIGMDDDVLLLSSAVDPFQDQHHHHHQQNPSQIGGRPSAAKRKCSGEMQVHLVGGNGDGQHSQTDKGEEEQLLGMEGGTKSGGVAQQQDSERDDVPTIRGMVDGEKPLAMRTSSPTIANTSFGDRTSDKAHCTPSFASSYAGDDNTVDEAGLMSTVGARKGWVVNQLDCDFGAARPVQQEKQGSQPRIERPPEKRQCFAHVQVQRVGNCVAQTLKFPFSVGDTHQSVAADISNTESFNPTVRQMMLALLPNHLKMSSAQLSAQFEPQLQIRDRDCEPDTMFIDIDKQKWCTELVEHRGTYKVLLHAKTNDRIIASGTECRDQQQTFKTAEFGAVHHHQQINQARRQHDESAHYPLLAAGGGPWADSPSRLGQLERERFNLSVMAPLANLYDVCTDNFVTSDDHGFMRNNGYNNSNDSLLTMSSKASKLREQFIEIDQLDDLKERTKMLGMDQQLSVISQLARLDNVCPLGHFLLKAAAQTTRTNSFGIIKIVPKMIVSLNLHDHQTVRHAVLQQLPSQNATHFVRSACYGSIVTAIVTFNNERNAGAKVDIATAKRIARNFFGVCALSFSDKALLTELNSAAQFSVFIDPSVDNCALNLNFVDGLNFIGKCAGTNLLSPITFTLAPLSILVNNNNNSLCSSAIPSFMIDRPQFEWVLRLVQSVNERKLQLRKSGQSMDEYYSYALTNEQLNTARQFLEQMESAKRNVCEALKEFIVQLRMGKTEIGPRNCMALEGEVRAYLDNCHCVMGHCDKMLREKKERIQEMKAKGVTYIGRGNRQQLSALFGAKDSNSLHFVLLNNPSAAADPSSLTDSRHDPGKVFYLCLGKLYEFVARGQCSFIDWDVLQQSDSDAKVDEGLPEDIRSLDGFPNIGTRLIKMRRSKLLCADCVAEEERKLPYYVARIDNIRRTEVGAVPAEEPKDVQSCSLPCPFCEGYGGKCANNDNLWECDDCLQMLTFVKRENSPITHFYCACGKTPVDAFSFRCPNVDTHGKEFGHFGSKESLDRELDRLNNKGVLTLLLLGETGVGKSTLINAFLNCLMHPTFDEAVQAKEVQCVIPARFCTGTYDEEGNWKKIEAVLGEVNEDECLDKHGESQTKWPKAYFIPSKDGHKVRIIDSPGIGDTRGVREDDANFDKTLNFISTLPELHAVCILMRPDLTRLTPAFKYCLNGLLTYLHKNATNNIVFMFTNARGTNYAMGTTGELLREFFAPIERDHQVQFPLHRDRIYCLDNEAFNGLCLISKANVQFSQKRMNEFSESWSYAEEEFQRLLKYVSTLAPHRTWETVSVNEARRTIIDLAHPLALITESIQINLLRINDQQDAISLGEEQLENAASLETVEFIALSYPRTVCTAPRCTKIQRTVTNDVALFTRHCHEHCFLENITPELFPNEGLKYCWAMDKRTHKCKRCGCDWSVHMHYHYEQSVKSLSLDEQKRQAFAPQRENLSTLEKDRLQMLHERETIYRKAAQFCAFLKKWALKPYNDSMEAYINMSIELAEKVVVECAGADDQKRQEDKLEGLRESLRLYQEQKELIDQTNEDASDGPKVITAEGVKKFFNELCALPIFGESIRQMVETKQKARNEHQKEYSETKTGVGLKLKPSRSGKVVHTDQYLNEEQRKLLETYEAKKKELEFLEQKMDRMNQQRTSAGNTSAAFRRSPTTPTSSKSFWSNVPVLGPFFDRWSFAQQTPSTSASSSRNIPYSSSSFSNNNNHSFHTNNDYGGGGWKDFAGPTHNKQPRWR